METAEVISPIATFFKKLGYENESSVLSECECKDVISNEAVLRELQSLVKTLTSIMDRHTQDQIFFNNNKFVDSDVFTPHDSQVDATLRSVMTAGRHMDMFEIDKACRGITKPEGKDVSGTSLRTTAASRDYWNKMDATDTHTHTHIEPHTDAEKHVECDTENCENHTNGNTSVEAGVNNTHPQTHTHTHSQ
eukprot:GHVR01031994.1.p1 GENE.GHVR01031994.1~~GHVR01031994.1.p1  ORF type:complete len:192 (-),score=80.48 GHVR01031994.1:518-1093(-)